MTKREWLHPCRDCGGWRTLDRRVCLGCERSAELGARVEACRRRRNRGARPANLFAYPVCLRCEWFLLDEKPPPL
jgi:hypothetical protein